MDEEHDPEMLKVAEEAENASKTWADEYELVAYGRVCPDQFTNSFTPMEFEEMVVMFNKYDVDNSDSIDKHEARKILFDLGMEYGLDKAEELFDAIDENHTGDISFEHFCKFFLMIKSGDERLTGFADLLDQIKNTPLGVIEAQTKARGLGMNFVTVECREATATSAPMFIVELQIAGDYLNYVPPVLTVYIVFHLILTPFSSQYV